MSSLLLSVAVAQAMAEHRFEFVAPATAQRVEIAGDFNGWQPPPMTRAADGRTWTAVVRLAYGKRLYKFVVDGAWQTDPKAAKNEDDGGGNLNSVLVVTPPDYAKPARPKDGVVAATALLHETGLPMRNWDRGRMQLSLRARPGDLGTVRLIAGGKTIPMREIARDDLYATYRAETPWNRKAALRYRFEVDGQRFGPKGLGDRTWFVADPKSYRPFVVPQWVEGSVIYQIFPDRFENGDPRNDPKELAAWNAEPTWFSRHGGDVAGVRKRLPYLRSLGIDAVYFNPVFASPAIHRYEADDFTRIDPQFGTDAEFTALTKRMQTQGIRTILDFAFNHTSTGHPAFADLLKNQQASRFKDWYFVRSWPVKVEMPPPYEAWFGFASMPKLNAKNPAVRDHLLAATRHWLNTIPLGGVRLDVPNEVDSSFWREFRRVVKGHDASTWITGEIWGDGNPWLKGDQFDSVMNYPFRSAMVDFVAQDKIDAAEFARRLMQGYASYPPQVSRNLMNLLSSHDTVRFLTEAGGDRALAKMAATIQFGWVGTPSVYYGEEVGMEGGKDPQNRRGMRWDMVRADNGLLAHYRRLVRLRRSLPVLQSGDPSVLLAKGRQAVFARSLGTEGALLAANRAGASHTFSIRVPEGTAFAVAKRLGFVDALTGREFRVTGGRVSFLLGPKSAALLLPNTRAMRRAALASPGPLKAS